jgi:hypothetical protein
MPLKYKIVFLLLTICAAVPIASLAQKTNGGKKSVPTCSFVFEDINYSADADLCRNGAKPFV